MKLSSNKIKYIKKSKYLIKSIDIYQDMRYNLFRYLINGGCYV